jgi:hypothetical protein
LKKILKFLLLLLDARNGAQAASSSHVWNGKADTKWYNDSETEFTITTPEQLAGLAKLVNKGNDFSRKTIKLGANIMLNDTANWQNWDKKAPKNKWKPIGFEKVSYFGHIGHLTLSHHNNNYFSGTFDSNGFVVSGVYVSESGSYKGLFGDVVRGVIKNLGVTASYIKGGTYVGGLVGYLQEGTISNSYFSGTVIGSLFVGGLAGEAKNIINSYSIGTVTGEKMVGGLVGDSNGQIINSYSIGTVIGRINVGGLAGNGGNDIISSYSTGAVSGKKRVGGLVGYSIFNTSNSYSTSTVTGDSLVGGLVGVIGFDGHITDSYSTGAVIGKIDVGGLVGKILNRGKVTNSYYSKETSGHSDMGKGEGKSIAEMKQKETFESWNFDNVWAIYDTANGGYPHLKAVQ